MRSIVAVGAILVLGSVAFAVIISVVDSSQGGERRAAEAQNPINNSAPENSPVPADDNAPGNALDNGRCVEGESGVESPISGRTIILDPGHGGEDLGTVNDAFGLTESELVLPISEKTRDRLVASGANVCLTRIDDTYIGLGDRAEFANDQSGDAFVSIHLNSLPDPDESYVMAMWGNEAKDRFLAKSLVDVLRYDLATPEWNGGQQNPINPEIYLLRGLESRMLQNARMPAALVEASFLSASWEAQAFSDGINDGSRWREHQIADAIHDGLVKYFENFR